MKEIPQLREKQIEQLSFYISHPKCLDLSDPGTGKTPPVCVYSYYVWKKDQKQTIWTMPKSLLKKNLKEMVRFTEFNVANVKKYTPGDDVVILHTDRAALTKNWTGPTIESTRKQRGWKVKLPGSTTPTDTIELRRLAGRPIKFMYQRPHKDANGLINDWEWVFLEKRDRRPVPILDNEGTGKPEGPDIMEIVPIMGPDGEPQQVVVETPEVFKDLIAEVARHNPKVLIATFAFMSMHWQRVFEAMPEIDLLLVDELHMPGGYSTPESKATESFYWMNRMVSRYVGMTGTPINGRLDSIYSSISVIEPRYYGSFIGFMAEHAAVVDDYGRVTVWKNEHKLSAILDRHSIKRTFEEVYGKEPVVFFTETLDLSDEVRVEYDKFHEQAMLELDDGRVLDGSSPGVAFIRARQLLQHPETMLKNIPKWTPKDDRLAIHLMEGKKTIIYASLQPEQERIVRLCEELGLRVGLINANVTGRARERVDEDAQAGLLDVIVASGPTAAVGFNWEMFDLVIFASIDFLDSNILQAYRRASRGSRTSILRVIFMRYADTVEDKQYGIVKAKSQLANRVDGDKPVLEFES